jgi:hypothetical protein
MGRPSHTELRGKILKARGRIGSADWSMASPEKQVAEFRDLNLWTATEMAQALEVAANEIDPEHYVGMRPPMRSYERVCKDAELFAFAWESAHFERKMYLKFCFVKETLFIISFHPDRTPKEEL